MPKNTTPTTPEGEGAAEGENQQQPVVWDEFIQGQGEPVREAFTQHVSGLRTALSDERDARKGLEKQLRDLGKEAEKGSKLEAQLNSMADTLAGRQQQLEFYEEASQRGIQYLDVAYNTAVSAQAIDGRGRINWELLEDKYPIIFKPTKPKPPEAGAGSGTDNQTPPGPAKDMNAFIRAKAGRR